MNEPKVKSTVRRMSPVMGECSVCGHLTTLTFSDDQAEMKVGTCCVMELVAADSAILVATNHGD